MMALPSFIGAAFTAFCIRLFGMSVVYDQFSYIQISYLEVRGSNPRVIAYPNIGGILWGFH